MLELLRFAPGGEPVYRRFLTETAAVWERYCAEIVYAGSGHPALVADPDQAWDGVMIVRYPSRGAFCAMTRDPAYRARELLLTGALAQSVVQPTTPFT